MIPLEFTASFVSQRTLDWVSAHATFAIMVLLVGMPTADSRVIIPVRGIREAEAEGGASAGRVDQSAMRIAPARRQRQQRRSERQQRQGGKGRRTADAGRLERECEMNGRSPC